MFAFLKKKPEATSTSSSTKVSGKGHATPTRKEAQAAAKLRAQNAVNPSSSKAEVRAQRAAAGARMREAMRTGEEKYLPERDKGPVRRFVRDWIDARLTFIELLLPMLVIVMMLSLGKSREMQSLASTLYSALWILVIIDVTWLSIRLVGELKRRFPEHDRKGWWFYAIMRALQLRPLRMPKPQVKLFTKLPDTYR